MRRSRFGGFRLSGVQRLVKSVWKKTVITWVVSVALIFLALEGIARLVVDRRAAHPAEGGKRAIIAKGLAALTNIMESDPYLFWVLKPGLRDYAVVGKIDQYDVAFSFSTNELRLRNPPLEPKGERTRVLAVGDSATFGLGVNDGETWPAQLQVLLNKATADGAFEVVNAGVPGYSAFQGRRYLEKHGLSLAPDIVIISFWANDKAAWASKSDMEIAEELSRIERDAPLMRSRLYVGLKRIAERLSPPPEAEALKGRSRLSEDEFSATLKEIHDLCKARDIPAVFVIWPSRIQVAERQTQLYGYQRLVNAAARELATPVVDLAPAFIQSPEDPFIDDFHGSVAGCTVAAEAVAAEVRRIANQGKAR